MSLPGEVAPAVYGTQGVPSSLIFPGGRNGASSWTDNTGDLWLYGGQGYTANSGPLTLNDLWKFSPSVGTWEWVDGFGPAVFGNSGHAVHEQSASPDQRSELLDRPFGQPMAVRRRWFQRSVEI